MDQFSYQNQGTISFLIYTLLPGEQVDQMSIGMITNNKIPSLLPVAYTQIDENCYLRYNISSKVNLNSYFSGVVNRKRLLTVFNGICEAIIEADSYMLESNMFVLDKQYIFANVSTSEPSLVYLPLIKEREPLDVCRFFKEIMFGTQFDQMEDCGYVAQIINFLNASKNFSLPDFRRLIQSLLSSTKDEAANTSVVRPLEQVKPSSNLSGVAEKVAVPKVQTPLELSFSEREKQAVKEEAKPEKPSPDTGNGILPVVPPVTTKAKEEPAPAKKKGFLSSLFSTKGKQREPEKKPAYKPPMNGVNIPGKAPEPLKEVKSGAMEIPKAGEQNSSMGMPAPASPQKPMAIPPQPVLQPMAKPVEPSAQSQGVKVVSPMYGGTTVLCATAGETTVLNSSPEIMQEPQVQRAFMKRLKTGQEFEIDKPVFRIGKEKSYVDYFVADNPAVSRSHADIICRNGQYYIKDNNSTNHTYVQGEMLTSNTEYPLQSEWRVQLANEEFLFVIR